MQFRSRLLSRHGSASLLVLGVLTVCLVLLTGTQASLSFTATRQRIDRNNQLLRSACLLGFREGMSVLQEDRQPAFDDLREAWAEPIRFITSDQVQLRVQITDAQSRFDVNRLAQPVSPSMVRTPEDMLSDLFEIRGIPIDRDMIRQLAKDMREEDRTLQDPLQFLSIEPPLAESLGFVLGDLSALPRPATGVSRINLNTVRPAVLSAVLGPQLDGWVTQVVSAREAAPIPSVGSLTTGLPPFVQNLLSQVLDVRSMYFEVIVTAVHDDMEQELTALVRRGPSNALEVIRCQW